MAMRAPSCASRNASPRPIPLLPPVTSATRLRSDILLPSKISWKDFQYSPAAPEVLPKPCDNDRHVIHLLRSPRPLLRRCHKRLCDHERRGSLQTNRSFLYPANPKFLAVNILRLNQSVTVANHQSIGSDLQGALLINVIIENPKNHAALFQELRRSMTNEKRGQVTCVRISQRSGDAVVDSDKEGREAVVARVADQMLIQTGHEFRSAQAVAALRKQLAAQRRLKTGHQKGSGNSLPRNIGDGQGNMSRAKLNKVIIVTTD